MTRFSLSYQAIVIAAVAVAMAAGVWKFFTMPRRADPDFTIRTCQVATRWPGTETTRVEQLVTHPLEQEISTLGEVLRVRSTTTTGLSVIYVELEPTLPVSHIQQVWDRVRARVDIVRPDLPQGVMDPVVNDDFGDTAVMLVAVYEQAELGEADARTAGGRYSSRQLETIAERIQERIALMPAVAKAELHGELREAVYLETQRGTWAHLDLTISGLEDLLRARNVQASGGSIDTPLARFGIQPTGELNAVAQVEGLVVRRDSSGAPIYLKDLDIWARRGYEDPPTTKTRFGNPGGAAECIIVSFTMKAGYKVTDLGRDVRRLLRDLKETDKVIPPDVVAEVVFDESTFVEHKIRDFTGNVVQAVAIVLGVALLMAGLRSALVMAAAIPFVMVIAIGVSAMIGVELEQMSIASLIIALGMLVDNAVVVSDNVRRFQREGYSRREAVVRGVEQIQYPILMGTLTTVFAFVPLAFFLTGEKQEYVFSIPAVVSITLLTSWVLAVTLTALMVYWIIRPAPEGQEEKLPLARLADAMRKRRGKEASAAGPSLADRYSRLIALCLNAKALVLGVSVLLLVGVFFLPIGTEFFPDDNRDYLYIDVWLPEGASLENTDRAVRQVEEILRELSPLEDEDSSSEGGQRLARFYSSIGGSGPRFALGVNPQPPAANFAQIIVQTTDANLTEDYVQAIRLAAEKTVPGARVIPRKLSLGPPVDTPIGVRIYGAGFADPGFADESQMRREAAKLEKVFADMDGLWDVHNSWGELGYQLDVEINEERANLSGVTNASVAKTFQAYYSGHYLTSLREEDRQIPIYLRLPADERKLSDPRTIFVEGSSGKVPLDVAALTVPRRAVTKIERREKNRMIEVRARVEPGVLANVKLAEAMPDIERLKAALPHGFSYEMGGMLEKSEESASEMSMAFGVAIVLIVLCLIVQYNSFVKPIVILMTVPMGAIGAFFGLWVTGNPLGFMPMLGLVSLTGIVVNSGILYLEFADALIKEKLESQQGLAAAGEKSCNGLTRETFRGCLAEAGKLRLLPIFLTVSTTVGGLLPLAFFGGPMWEGMAWLLIFGLIIATALTLLVLPVIYAVFVEFFGARMVRVEEE